MKNEMPIMQTAPEILNLRVLPDEHGQRLDLFLTHHCPEVSRSHAQSWIKQAHVCIDAEPVIKPRTLLRCDQEITVNIPKVPTLVDLPEAIALDIAYEDDDLIVVNKPAGLVVHPGAGNRSGTLLNALLHHHPCAESLPRAGIIHRLDKNTSGLMMIAKTSLSYKALTQALAARQIQRYYYAAVDGCVKTAGSIEQPIARHPIHRQKMAIHPSGKPAHTSWEIANRLRGYTLLKVKLHTGRTHQIRVHMQSLGHPLLGDPTYGRHRGYQQLPSDIAAIVLAFKRQALHAYQLQLTHPVSHKPMAIRCPLPEDMRTVLDALALSP